MDEQDQKALDDIEQYGCHVLNIMEGEGEPCFSYSIGINKKQGKPDLVVVGLKRELAHSIINNYKDRLLEGEVIEPGKFYSDFLGGFDVLQLIWPTTDGVWPWDDNKSDYYKWAQPILNEKGVVEKIS